MKVKVSFTPRERSELNAICSSIGASPSDFIKQCTMITLETIRKSQQPTGETNDSNPTIDSDIDNTMENSGTPTVQGSTSE